MTARNHHYLSQCYLKGFTESLSKNSKLYVYDLKRKNKFETIPRNVGAIRDFNRIEINDIAPDSIENMYSKLEDKFASSIKKLNNSLQFENEIKDYILLLIAILSTRSPEHRENWRQFHEDISKKTLSIFLSKKEIWDEQVELMKNDGIKVDESFSYEKMKDFHKKENYRINLSNAGYISIELEMAQAVLPYLHHRKWRLIQTDDKIGTFITSDNPMILTWKNYEDVIRPAWYGPGHGLDDTIVYFPVTKYLALLGEFNGQEGVFWGNEKAVASLNTLKIIYTYKQVYTARNSFKFLDKTGNIFQGELLFDHFLKYSNG